MKFKEWPALLLLAYRVSGAICVKRRQLFVTPAVPFSTIFFIDDFLNPNSFCHTRLIATKIAFFYSAHL